MQDDSVRNGEGWKSIYRGWGNISFNYTKCSKKNV